MSKRKKLEPTPWWGGQSWPQPPFRRLRLLESGSAGRIARPTIAGLALASLLLAASPNFLPDFVFKGSSLTGWHKMGNADWRAENGEIVGTPKDGSGGWLVLEKGYQDIAFYSNLRCTGPCNAGVMLRAEKTASGYKGVYVSLSDGNVGSYEVTLDGQGKELSRTRLATGAPQMVRMSLGRTSGPDEPVPGFAKLPPPRTEAPPAPRPAALPPSNPPANANANAGRGGRGGGRDGPSLQADDWNTVQIIMDADLLTLAVNGGRGGPAGITSDQMMGFG